MYKVGDHVDWQGIPGKIIRGTPTGDIVWEPDDINKFFVKATSLGYPAPIAINLFFRPDGSIPPNSVSHHKYPLDPAAIALDRLDDDGGKQNRPCWHNYKLYNGFSHVYEYCTYCGNKREASRW